MSMTNEKKILAIEIAISKERFSKYVNATNGSRLDALRLYEWNKAASGAFYCLLQETEVIVRNALNLALTNKYGKFWFDNSEVGLDASSLEQIKSAKKSTPDYAVNPEHIIPCLSFGFWVNLLSSGMSSENVNYEMTLWRPALSSVFPRGLTRKMVYQQILILKILRNRIAHHEPIFMRNLENDYESILKVIGWISPEVRDWISSASRVPEILSDRNGATPLMF